MDSVTQLQNYLSSITTFMSQSLQHATHGAGTVTIEQLTEALKAEHTQHREMQAQAQAQSLGGAGVSSGPSLSSLSDLSVDPGVGPSPPSVPDLAAPLFSGLQPGVEFAMTDRAHQLFKRIIEADVLLASLPSELGPDAQRKQMEQLAFLELYNQQAGRELEEAQAEAKIWQQRVTFILQQAAAGQLKTRQQATTE